MPRKAQVSTQTKQVPTKPIETNQTIHCEIDRKQLSRLTREIIHLVKSVDANDVITSSGPVYRWHHQLLSDLECKANELVDVLCCGQGVFETMNWVSAGGGFVNLGNVEAATKWVQSLPSFEDDEAPWKEIIQGVEDQNQRNHHVMTRAIDQVWTQLSKRLPNGGQIEEKELALLFVEELMNALKEDQKPWSPEATERRFQPAGNAWSDFPLFVSETLSRTLRSCVLVRDAIRDKAEIPILGEQFISDLRDAAEVVENLLPPTKKARQSTTEARDNYIYQLKEQGFTASQVMGKLREHPLVKEKAWTVPTSEEAINKAYRNIKTIKNP